MEEQMITLTKDQDLPWDIIKKIRKAFAKARVVPNDPQIIARLKEERLLD